MRAHGRRSPTRRRADPLDTPTAEQGEALAALDSERWSVEPGSSALSTHGHGLGPIDAIGLFGELRAHDLDHCAGCGDGRRSQRADALARGFSAD